MFKAKIKEAKLLKHSIEAVSQLITETTLDLKKDGLELIAMDSANVSLVEFKLGTQAFESYKVDKSTSVGVSMEDLTQILKRVKPTESVEISLNDNQNRLELVLAGKRKFDIPLLDLGESSTRRPSLQFPTEVEMKTELLEEGLSDAEIVSDAIILEANKDKFLMRAVGDGRKVESELGKDELVGIKSKEYVKSMFPLDYLKKMMKGAKLSETAKLSIGNDYPLHLEFNGTGAKLSFILAPRIEND